MTIAFHHFFVFTSAKAPVVDRLLELGFIEGTQNTHAGQGTANRRIYFENGMLEFIWVEDLAEIRSSVTTPTHLWERSEYAGSKYSPFGIALCPLTPGEDIPKPFAGWSYRPAYLPEHYSIWMAQQDNYPWEPVIFYMDFSSPINERVKHHNGARRIARITLTTDTHSDEVSEAVAKLSPTINVDIVKGSRCHVEIVLSGESSSVVDLGALCPMTLILRNY